MKGVGSIWNHLNKTTVRSNDIDDNLPKSSCHGEEKSMRGRGKGEGRSQMKKGRAFISCVVLIALLLLLIWWGGGARVNGSSNSLNSDTSYDVVDIWKDEKNRSSKESSGKLEDTPVPKNWKNCAYRMFRLNERGEEAIPVERLNEPIPMLSTILMTDVDFLPRFLCTIDVPVKYWFIIQSGADAKTEKVVRELEVEFNRTGRLIIHRSRQNLGFAGGHNIALRWAMTLKSAAEIPFFFLFNVDVAFSPGILRKMLTPMYNQAAADATILAELEEEVRMEEQMIRDGNFSWYEKYVPKGRPLHILREGFPGVPTNIHTAPLLPDRLRYLYSHATASKIDLTNRVFSNHTAIFYPSYLFMACTAVMRLPVAVAGYMDEGFFPIYMEDIDWRWRIFSFGFKEAVIETDASVVWHHNGANYVLEDSTCTEDNCTRSAFRAALRRKKFFYERSKFGNFFDRKKVFNAFPPKNAREFQFFDVPYYPVDVWVDDFKQKQCFFTKTFDASDGQWHRPGDCLYDCSVVKQAGILGHEQMESLSCVW